MPAMKNVAIVCLMLVLFSVSSSDGTVYDELPPSFELLDGAFDTGDSVDDSTRRISRIKHALRKGADVNVMLPASENPPFWGTALMAASFRNDICALKILLDNGADANIVAPDGTTALIAAALKNSLEAAAFLVDHGANINTVGYEGKTALIIAQEKKNEAMVAILQSKKGKAYMALLLQGKINKKKWSTGNDDHNLYGTKWGACGLESEDKVCAFDPFNQCQFPVTEATVTYKFIADGAEIKINKATQSITDIDKFYNKPGYEDISYKSLMRSAFTTWDNCSGIKFKEVNGSDATADIRVGIYGPLPRNKDDVPPHALSYPPPYPEKISEEYWGDIYFNTVETEVVNRDKNEMMRRFYLVALHEIGHAIGLKHSGKESIMFGDSNQIFDLKPTLYHSDLEQAIRLYSHNYSLMECSSSNDFSAVAKKALKETKLVFKGAVSLPETAQSDFIFSDTEDGKKIPLGFTVRCNYFDIEYHPGSGTPNEYITGLTVLEDGKEVLATTIKENKPLTYKGVTFHQVSYKQVGAAIIKLREKHSDTVHAFPVDPKDYSVIHKWRQGESDGMIRIQSAQPIQLSDGKPSTEMKIWMTDSDGPPSMFTIMYGNSVIVERPKAKYELSIGPHFATGLQVEKRVLK
ncbi:MAG: cytochrome c biogenesis protein ResB [Candidatus Electrothrix aestuarii]|uniref:Cytochrome c biogenesis protein ResB n=1 Tax=Candidatus Electrothrix aestuarii TaxID=3062594 RepID=A0AAU8LS16_9BACT|nr:ankyrin repeat domain-containing protein [Candidatus Electrothrix aestuarii]